MQTKRLEIFMLSLVSAFNNNNKKKVDEALTYKVEVLEFGDLEFNTYQPLLGLLCQEFNRCWQRIGHAQK